MSDSGDRWVTNVQPSGIDTHRRVSAQRSQNPIDNITWARLSPRTHIRRDKLKGTV